MRKVPPIETPSVVERLRARAEMTGDERVVPSRRGEVEADGRMLTASFTDGRSTRTEERERSQEQVRVT